MEEEYLFTLEEIRTAVNMGMEVALLVLAQSTRMTTEDIKCTSQDILKMISESFLKKVA